ncbi:hypothetical protein [Cryobacterium roopkundense]|nr:hypothetical protein [Cryobacterium roopkundense]MBB5641779.1 hypothetical protein [Cryobacterium roopkundense]
MNTINMPEGTIPFACSIEGCVGPTYDPESHAEADALLNLHNAVAYENDLLEVTPAMFTATEGRWILSVEIANEMTPAEAIAAADELHRQAERVQALNDAVEAQAWFDTHPNPLGESVSSVMYEFRDRRAALMIIVARCSLLPALPIITA